MQQIRKLISLVIFLFPVFLFSQEFIGFVNDDFVRLREEPGLEGKIIRHLNNKESVTYVASKDFFDGAEFKWLKVKTAKDEGWMYGEFISMIKPEMFRMRYVEDMGIVTRKGIIYSGMKEEELLKILGEPRKKSYDSSYNDYTYDYEEQEGLIFLVHQYNKRIHHIIIKSAKHSLFGNIKVGLNSIYLKDQNIEIDCSNDYYTGLINYIRSSFYDSSVIISTDEKGIIREIQIGLSSP